MSVLLLRLAGPMQSWGDSSRFATRQTRTEPTKSGVVGLLAAAQGRRRTDPVEDLAALSMGVRIDQRGRIERDFQTAARRDPGRPAASMPLSYRYYLSDALFVVGVEGDASLLAGLHDAVTAPAFPLFLGRRSYAPVGELSLGVVESDLASALRAAPWQASAWYRRQQGKQVHLDLVVDTSTGDGMSEAVRDVPLSFDPVRREYGWRHVVRPEPVLVGNDLGRDEMDFLAVYGGS